MRVPIYKYIYFFLSELEATLELRSGVALIIQYKITVGSSPVLGAAGKESGAVQGKQEVLMHLSSCWLYPSYLLLSLFSWGAV